MDSTKQIMPVNMHVGSISSTKDFKHCQRHNGPEGWVFPIKVTSLGHITSSRTNLDQISSQPSINFSFKILPVLQLQNLDKTLWSKSEQKLNFMSKFLSFQICTKPSSIRFSASTSATVTTSNSFELASSHARVTSINSTKQGWVS